MPSGPRTGISTAPPTVDSDDVAKLIHAEHADPFSVLGPHSVRLEGRAGVAIRALVPGAESLEAVVDGRGVPMAVVDAAGFFECVLAADERPPYRLRCRMKGGHHWEFEDAYRFPPVLGELDLHLFGEGNHFEIYEKLGAHLNVVEGIEGVHFAVWAPNAGRVSVVGDFNSWDGRRHPMRQLGFAGVWEIFIPDLAEGDLYKFEILTKEGHIRVKSDPYGFRFELRPGTSSLVHDLGVYEWSDSEWMEARKSWDWIGSPISIYEVHLGSWKRRSPDPDSYLTYRELAHDLADHVESMGFTHVELLPLQEHPFDGSWGYQPLGYFAPTSRHGSPEDFMYLVDHLHQRGIGVILDWVPAHFPRDDHGLRYFDGTHLYEHADPRQGEHLDWGTMIFNYGRNEVRNFLLASALFWLDRYHLDGIRVDAVASMIYLDYSRPQDEWIPNMYGGNENLEAISFLRRFNEVCHERHPGVLTIAEESTAFPSVSRPTYLGGLGFSMKWNMGWMNDTLYFMEREPIHRKYHHNGLTFSLLYAFTENFVLPLSHDEVVHGKQSLLDKMPGDAWQKFANLRLLLALEYTHPGKKLLFMGGEFGQGQEWNSGQSLDWHLLDIDWHRGVQSCVRDLNGLYRREAALHEVDFEWTGFEWVDSNDWEASIIAFRRRGRDPAEELLVALNFTPVPRGGYRLGVPLAGFYRELFSSDATCYCGSGKGNYGGLMAEPIASHGQPYSLNLTLPPLGAVVLKRDA